MRNASRNWKKCARPSATTSNSSAAACARSHGSIHCSAGRWRRAEINIRVRHKPARKRHSSSRIWYAGNGSKLMGKRPFRSSSWSTIPRSLLSVPPDFLYASNTTDSATLIRAASRTPVSRGCGRVLATRSTHGPVRKLTTAFTHASDWILARCFNGQYAASWVNLSGIGFDSSVYGTRTGWLWAVFIRSLNRQLYRNMTH